MLETERSRLRDQRVRIDETLEVIDTMNFVGALLPGPVRLVQRDDVPTLSVSARSQPERLHLDTERLIARLLGAADRAGIDTSPPVIGEFPLDLGEDIPITVHLPVTEPVPSDTVQGALTGMVPGGRFSSTTHVGPHNTLAVAYQRLLTATAPSGDGPTAPRGGTAIERYLDDPHRTPATEIRTEVMVRLEP